jgi:hypothetical protein
MDIVTKFADLEKSFCKDSAALNIAADDHT